MGQVYLVKKTKRKYLDEVTQNEKDLVQIFFKSIMVLRKHSVEFLCQKTNLKYSGRKISLFIFSALCKKFTNMTRAQIGSFVERDADQIEKYLVSHDNQMKDPMYRREYERHEIMCLFMTKEEKFISGNEKLVVSSSELSLLLTSFGISKIRRAEIMSAIFELASFERPVEALDEEINKNIA